MPTTERQLFLFSLIGLFIVYIPTFYHLYGAWFFDPYYSHGFLVPLVSVYLAWMMRKGIGPLAEPQGRHPIGLLAAGFLLYVIGLIVDFRFLMYLSFVVSLSGMVLFVWGKRLLKEMWFPIGYLLLMIPLPYAVTSNIAFPLQLASSRYASLALDLLGISALQEGVNIYIPGFSFVIERGCSGLRSIVALVTLSILFAYLVQGTVGRRIFLVFSAIPIALVSNLTRIIVVVLIAKFWGREAAESFFHEFSSLMLFSLAFLMLIATAGFIGCLPSRK
jgi:exosortase